MDSAFGFLKLFNDFTNFEIRGRNSKNFDLDSIADFSGIGGLQSKIFETGAPDIIDFDFDDSAYCRRDRGVEPCSPDKPMMCPRDKPITCPRDKPVMCPRDKPVTCPPDEPVACPRDRGAGGTCTSDCPGDRTGIDYCPREGRGGKPTVSCCGSDDPCKRDCFVDNGWRPRHNCKFLDCSNDCDGDCSIDCIFDCPSDSCWCPGDFCLFVE